jgi:hypothetical protein
MTYFMKTVTNIRFHRKRKTTENLSKDILKFYLSGSFAAVCSCSVIVCFLIHSLK